MLDTRNEDAAHVANTLRRLGEEFASHRNGRNDLLDAYLTSSLLLTARIAQKTEEGSTLGDENERRMEMLQGLIQRHFRSHKPAAFYAENLGISPAHLSRIVRSKTGHGAHELITRKLLDEAKRELVFTFATVQEISYRLGFADPAYFSRFFVKQTGLTPRAWRIEERERLGM
jgi:AraC family transcriptional activator of pobA